MADSMIVDYMKAKYGVIINCQLGVRLLSMASAMFRRIAQGQPFPLFARASFQGIKALRVEVRPIITPVMQLHSTTMRFSSDIVFETTSETFMKDVVQSPVPIVLDCYADWCGPCKKLAPVLEAAVRATGGKIKMAKLNTDKHMSVAQALRVQSLPTVYALHNGKVVNSFVGAISDEEVKRFVKDFAASTGNAKTLDSTLKQANEALENGDVSTAAKLFSEISQNSEWKGEAIGLSGLARCAMVDKNLELAGHLINTLKKDHNKQLDHPEVVKAINKYELAQNTKEPSEIEELRQQAANNPRSIQAQYDLALALFSYPQYQEEAIEIGLEILKQDREWNDGAAKSMLIKFFDSLGKDSPLAQKGRRTLTNLLFV